MIRRTGYRNVKASTTRNKKIMRKSTGREKEGKIDETGDDSAVDGEAETRARMSREGKRAEDARTARFLRASALKREANSSLAKF